jgi:trigger factor
MSQKALTDRDLRAAMQPKIEMEGALEDVVESGADLAYTLQVELMPDFEIMDLKTITIEKPVAEVPQEEIDDAIKTLAEQSRTYSDREDGAKAEMDDAVVMDFVGTVDGEEFEGGKGEDVEMVLGSGRLIPGFEEQLVGKAVGDETTVKVTFPDDYPAENLKGKDAEFAVTVKGVKAPDEIAIDDALAEKMGLENLDALKTAMGDRMKEDYTRMTRAHVKRHVLDALDTGHAIELPSGMVDGEFDQIWAQIEQAREAGQADPEDADKSDDELKKEYRAIAERRVRLGIVLAEIGRVNDINVAPEDLQRGIAERARQFPGQEAQVFQFYQQNPQALAEVRAPLYEEKVVDFVVELATVEEKTVSKDELFKEPDADLPSLPGGAVAAGQGHSHDHDHDHDHDH